MSTLAQPIVTEKGITLFLLAQDYLEGMVDQWAEDTHREGTYTPDAHGHLFGLVDYAGRLDETLKAGKLHPDHLANMELERYELCTATVATMHALHAGHSLAAITGSGPLSGSGRGL